MSSSVAADVYRVDQWDRQAARDADGSVKTSSVSQPRAQATHSSGATVRTPPWPQRRLNDALAELGPARPSGANVARPWARADDAETVETTAPASVAPDFIAGPANDTPAPDAAPEVRGNIPPPPRPVRCSVAVPRDAVPASHELFDWDNAVLPEVDAAGEDIVRALALINSTPEPAPFTDMHDENERPPMIIERALAEQGLGLSGAVPAARQLNPLPALTFGFSLSLLFGAALYIVMIVA